MQFENNEPVALSIPSGNSINTISVNLVNNDLTESQGRIECLKESEEGVHMIQATTSPNDVLSHLPGHMKCRARPPMTGSIAVFKRHLLASSRLRETEVPLAHSVRKKNFCNYLKSNYPRVSRKTPIHKISEQRRKIFLTDLTSSNKEKQVADKNEQENKIQTDKILPTKRPLEDDLRNDIDPTKKKQRISHFSQKDLSPHMKDNSNKDNKKFEGNRSHSETLAATDFISALLSSRPANNLNLLSPLENFEPIHSPVHHSEGTANFSDNKENEAPEKMRNISLGSNQFNSFSPVDDGIIKESTCKRSLGIPGTSDPCCYPECVLANDCSNENERNRQSVSRGQVKVKRKTDRRRKRHKNPQQDPTDCERPDTKLYREILRNDTSFIDIVNLKKIKSLEEREIASSYMGRYHQFYAELCYRIPIHSKVTSTSKP